MTYQTKKMFLAHQIALNALTIRFMLCNTLDFEEKASIVNELAVLKRKLTRFKDQLQRDKILQTFLASS